MGYASALAWVMSHDRTGIDAAGVEVVHPSRRFTRMSREGNMEFDRLCKPGANRLHSGVRAVDNRR